MDTVATLKKFPVNLDIRSISWCMCVWYIPKCSGGCFCKVAFMKEYISVVWLYLLLHLVWDTLGNIAIWWISPLLQKYKNMVNLVSLDVSLTFFSVFLFPPLLHLYYIVVIIYPSFYQSTTHCLLLLWNFNIPYSCNFSLCYFAYSNWVILGSVIPVSNGPTQFNNFAFIL